MFFWEKRGGDSIEIQLVPLKLNKKISYQNLSSKERLNNPFHFSPPANPGGSLDNWMFGSIVTNTIVQQAKAGFERILHILREGPGADTSHIKMGGM